MPLTRVKSSYCTANLPRISSKTPSTMMQQYSIAAFVLGLVAVLLSSTVATGSVISCPPNNPQETSTNLKQLCFAIEQVLSEAAAAQQDQSVNRMEERNIIPNLLPNSNGNAKRQDVDHVFLRFGRRFGL